MVIQEAPGFAGVGAEIAARVQERCFHSLHAPVLRVTGLDIPYPAPKLEHSHLPGVDRVLDAVGPAAVGRPAGPRWLRVGGMTTIERHQVFLLPDLGEGLTEAEIVAWRVAVGDVIEVDQSVVEVETAKAVVDVPCPYAGRVVALHGAPGEARPVGQPLITVEPVAEARRPPARDHRERSGRLRQRAGRLRHRARSGAGAAPGVVAAGRPIARPRERRVAGPAPRRPGRRHGRRGGRPLLADWW